MIRPRTVHTPEFLAAVKLYYSTNKNNTAPAMALHFKVTDQVINKALNLIYNPK